MTAGLELAGCRSRTGDTEVLHGIDLDGGPRRAARRARPVRRGQVHAAAGRRRARSRSTRRPRGDRRARRHRGCGPGQRNVSMVFQSLRALPAPDRRRQHRVRARRSATCRRRGGRERARRPPPRSGCAHLLDRRPGPALRRRAAAGGAGPRAGPRARRLPARRAAVQPRRRAAGARCAPSSRRCTTGSARRRCTSPTTRPRRWRSATGSRCCATAGSSRSARRTRSGARPATTFVARFVGAPAMNLLPGRRAAAPGRAPAARAGRRDRRTAGGRAAGRPPARGRPASSSGSTSSARTRYVYLRSGAATRWSPGCPPRPGPSPGDRVRRRGRRGSDVHALRRRHRRAGPELTAERPGDATAAQLAADARAVRCVGLVGLVARCPPR